LALSQFNRESVKADMPDMSHLRDSGSLEQDARIIMFLSEDKKNDEQIEEEERTGKKEIVFRIAKNSEGESKVGRRLQFYGATQRFYE